MNLVVLFVFVTYVACQSSIPQICTAKDEATCLKSCNCGWCYDKEACIEYDKYERRCPGNFTSRHSDDCKNDISNTDIVVLVLFLLLPLMIIIMLIAFGIYYCYYKNYTIISSEEDGNL